MGAFDLVRRRRAEFRLRHLPEARGPRGVCCAAACGEVTLPARPGRDVLEFPVLQDSRPSARPAQVTPQERPAAWARGPSDRRRARRRGRPRVSTRRSTRRTGRDPWRRRRGSSVGGVAAASRRRISADRRWGGSRRCSRPGGRRTKRVGAPSPSARAQGPSTAIRPTRRPPPVDLVDLGDRVASTCRSRLCSPPLVSTRRATSAERRSMRWISASVSRRSMAPAASAGLLRPRGAGDGDDRVAVVGDQPRQGDLGRRGPVCLGDVAELLDQRRRARQPLGCEVPAGRAQARPAPPAASCTRAGSSWNRPVSTPWASGE